MGVSAENENVSIIETMKASIEIWHILCGGEAASAMGISGGAEMRMKSGVMGS